MPDEQGDMPDRNIIGGLDACCADWMTCTLINNGEDEITYSLFCTSCNYNEVQKFLTRKSSGGHQAK
jgi:hypothetical protein